MINTRKQKIILGFYAIMGDTLEKNWLITGTQYHSNLYHLCSIILAMNFYRSSAICQIFGKC